MKRLFSRYLLLSIFLGSSLFGMQDANNRPTSSRSHDEAVLSSEAAIVEFNRYINKHQYVTDKTNSIAIERPDAVLASYDKKLQAAIDVYMDPCTRKSTDYRHALILLGKPGIGKSTLGFVIAKKIDAQCISVNANELGDKYKNTTPNFLKKLLRKAKATNKPVIIIIDEFATFFSKTQMENSHDKGALDSLMTFINELAGSEVLVILTSNELNNFPSHFFSRYNAITFHLKNPDLLARTTFINDRYKDKYSLDNEIIDHIIQLTQGMDYREIEDLFYDVFLVNKALLNKLPNEDLLTLLQNSKKQIIKRRDYFFTPALNWAKANPYQSLMFSLGILGTVCGGYALYQNYQTTNRQFMNQKAMISIEEERREAAALVATSSGVGILSGGAVCGAIKGGIAGAAGGPPGIILGIIGGAVAGSILAAPTAATASITTGTITYGLTYIFWKTSDKLQ